MINTFVFLDLETTNLILQNVMPRITELCLLAVSRSAILSSSNDLPRVQHKLVLPIHPKLKINQRVQSLTKLSNENLESVLPFECGTYEIIKHFLSRLMQPLCFVAHNGDNFDYPIFLWELAGVNEVIDENVLCIDTLALFRNFFGQKSNAQELNISKSNKPSSLSSDCNSFHFLLEDGYDEILCHAMDEYMTSRSLERSNRQLIRVKEEFHIKFLESSGAQGDKNDKVSSTSNNDKENNSTARTPPHKPHSDMQAINEKTPESQIIKSESNNRNVCVRQGKNVRKKLDFTDREPTNFKLGTLYKHMLGADQKYAHTAEGDCLSTLHCACKIGSFFVEWADNNAKPLRDLKKK